MSEILGPANAPDPLLIWQSLRQDGINIPDANTLQVDIMNVGHVDALLIVWRETGRVDLVLRPRIRVDKRLLILDNAMTVLADPWGWDWKTTGDRSTRIRDVAHLLLIGRSNSPARVTPQGVWSVDGGASL